MKDQCEGCYDDCNKECCRWLYLRPVDLEVIMGMGDE